MALADLHVAFMTVLAYTGAWIAYRLTGFFTT